MNCIVLTLVCAFFGGASVIAETTPVVGSSLRAPARNLNDYGDFGARLNFDTLSAQYTFTVIRNVSRSYGLLFTAYSTDEATFQRYYLEALAAARRCRETAPDMPIALAAGPDVFIKDYSFLEGIIDILVSIPLSHIPGGIDLRNDGVMRQWMTRILTIATFPFETTVSIDSQAHFCTRSFTRAIAALSATDFDIGYTVNMNTRIPHGWFLVFKRTEVTEILLAQWVAEQVSIGYARDDQHPLLFAIDNLRQRGVAVRTAEITRGLATAFFSYDIAARKTSPSTYPRLTAWVNDTVHVLHSTPLRDPCPFLNSQTGRRAFIVVEASLPPVVVNTEAECSALINAPCNYNR